jgi:hypothetical protein
MGDSDEFESSVELDKIEADTWWPEYEDVSDVEEVAEHIEELLEVFGTPAHGYVAVTAKSMEDEPAFAATVGVASLIKLLEDYGDLLDGETEEAFEDTKERLLRFEEARLRMDDE